MTRTEQEFEQEIKICRDIFEKKTRDYGTSWRILRLPSLTDQIFIKANRIRSIEETGVNKIGDDVRGEYVAMVNYAVMALIQQELENGERKTENGERRTENGERRTENGERRESERDRQGANGLSTENGERKTENGDVGGPAIELPLERALELYDKHLGRTIRLMLDKNHDYGEAWRQMRISSMTDLILMKLKRIKQIEDNDGRTVISEGVEGGYMDIINYSLFCLIRLREIEN